ncbi:cytochrome c maturation protein CcmE domain-containing protein [Aquirufa sp. ROCK2-A2]
MKKTHIVGLILIAVAIGIILTTTADVSTYVGFDEAEKIAQNDPNQKVHVVGKLKKDEQGKIVGLNFNAALDANRLEFIVQDSLGRENQVIYSAPKPQDFEKSEKIVLVGNMKSDRIFYCDKILLKCPSKYQEGKISADSSASLQAKN